MECTWCYGNMAMSKVLRWIWSVRGAMAICTWLRHHCVESCGDSTGGGYLRTHAGKRMM